MRAAMVICGTLLVALAAGCGGGSDATSTPTVIGSSAVNGSPTPTGEKTSTPVQATPSVAQTAPGETPSPPPVPPEGTPAAKPDNQAAFVAEFRNIQTDLTACSYNPGTGLADCNSVLYSLNPPVVGQDIQCTLWSVQGAPRALACTSAEPVATTYYKIG
jgi:hypothetical protein